MNQKLGAGGFWAFTVLIFALVFSVHRRMYVMPDAVSTAAGDLLGNYAVTWAIWWLVRWRMKDRAPNAKFFVVVVAGFLLLLENLGNIGTMLRN